MFRDDNEDRYVSTHALQVNCGLSQQLELEVLLKPVTKHCLLCICTSMVFHKGYAQSTNSTCNVLVSEARSNKLGIWDVDGLKGDFCILGISYANCV